MKTLKAKKKSKKDSAGVTNINQRTLTGEANNQSNSPTMYLDKDEVSKFAFPERERHRKRSEDGNGNGTTTAAAARGTEKKKRDCEIPPHSKQLSLTGPPSGVVVENRLHNIYTKSGQMAATAKKASGPFRGASGCFFNDGGSVARERENSTQNSKKSDNKGPSLAPSTISCGDNEQFPGVKQSFKDFDWKTAAARYIFRIIIMEDYLANYVDALASYREVDQESCCSLTKLLVQLSDSFRAKKMKDIHMMIPPNLSGLVCNLTACKPFYKKHFDIKRILKRNPKLFRIFKTEYVDTKYDTKPITTKSSYTVQYLHIIPKEEARKVLENILVEGLFLYFLAKFCHGAKFAINVSYYERSEPVRSSLIYATGCQKMSQALRAYFDTYSEIFVLSPDLTVLTMTSDYFDDEFRNSLKAYVKQNEEIFDVQGVVREISRDQGVVVVTFSEKSVAFYKCQENVDLYEVGAEVMFDAKFVDKSWIVKRLTNRKTRAIEKYFPEGQDLRNEVICNVTGKIRSILTPTSGIICFEDKGITEEAYFAIDDVFVDGKPIQNGPLEFFLQRESPVAMVVERQRDRDGVRFRALKVWIGNKEPCVFCDRNDEGKKICSKVQNFLGYNEDLDIIVRSVIRYVLGDDDDDAYGSERFERSIRDGVEADRTIIDRRVLESLVNKFDEFAVLKNPSFIKKLEIRVLELFSQMVVAENAN